jgi:hypothetical protein
VKIADTHKAVYPVNYVDYVRNCRHISYARWLPMPFDTIAQLLVLVGVLHDIPDACLQCQNDDHLAG